MSAHQRIGELLVAKGLITQDQLKQALADRGDTYFRLGEIVVSKGWVTEDDVLDCLAEQYHIPVVDLTRTHPSHEAVELLGLGYCLARQVLPLSKRGPRIVCAVADPLDNPLFQALEDAHGLEIELVLASPTEIREAIRRLMESQKPKV
ncbi:MAG: hypothetical protein WD716_05095 [Fimbriimonadaceae bacterium]|jgi:type IV pilus assembly protein PilB